jgi:hypothetical protein
MLLPKEPPYLHNLHGYYLELDRLVAHLQREIGSGCILCRSAGQRQAVFFNTVEIVHCAIEQAGRAACQAVSLAELQAGFIRRPFQVSVYFLDVNAVYHWAALPPYRQRSSAVRGAVTFDRLVERIAAKAVDGFIDLALPDGEGALLFFERGRRVGGSYSWGNGGLSPWQSDYDRMRAAMRPQATIGLKIGEFYKAPAPFRLLAVRGCADRAVTSGPPAGGRESCSSARG